MEAFTGCKMQVGSPTGDVRWVLFESNVRAALYRNASCSPSTIVRALTKYEVAMLKRAYCRSRLESTIAERVRAFAITHIILDDVY